MSEKKTDVFDLDGIRLLVELMKENDLSELDLEQDGRRLKLTRGGVVPAAFAAPVAPTAIPVPERNVENAPAEPKEEPVHYETILSPMVGTFYTSANPDKPPYVEVGDRVTPDQTVCIIEAMKVFNEVAAEISGKIVEVLVQNGRTVEYGTPLFKVDTRG